MSVGTRTDSIAAVMRRDRLVVWGGVVGLTLSAWLYLVHLAREMARVPTLAGAGGSGMTGMPGMAPMLMPWTLTDLTFTTGMWAVMMVGMMLPTAAPVILLFATVNRRRREQGAIAIPTGVFMLGYLVVWGGFSVAAALAQWGLHTAALLSPMMATTSPILGGLLLFGAGVYQLTPLKEACLAHCRSPLAFLMTEWREGVGGALRMGLRHGAFCLGCCWVLMGILFVTGVMNLVWVAAITVLVLVEKVAPGGVLIGRLASGALGLGGLVLLARQLLG